MKRIAPPNLTIACADVGSVVRGNFGWAIRDYPDPIVENAADASIVEFAEAIASRLAGGRSVALGFECPLFVPLRDDPLLLTRARDGEGNRPWSAGAGCSSLTTGLVQAAWILTRLRSLLPTQPIVHFSWPAFSAQRSALLLWEAFVTGEKKSKTHHGDAGLAVEAFSRALPRPDLANCVSEPIVLSLVGAVLLRTGWAVEPSVLHKCVLVLAA